MINKSSFFGAPVLIAGMAAGMVGLVTTDTVAQTVDDREKQLEQREQELLQREQELMKRLEDMQATAAPSGDGMGGEGMASVLPDAKPGQCFAKVLVPAEYDTKTEQVVIREASHRIEVVPAVYQTVEERVVVKDASDKVEEVPAVYDTVKEQVVVEPARTVWRKGRSGKAKEAPASWVAAAVAAGVPAAAPPGQCFAEFYQPAQYKMVDEKAMKREAATRIEIIPAKYEVVEEKVLVKEASEKIVDIPSVYDTVEEQVLERAAYTTWKSGRGPIERIDNSTGEIMCLVEVPAKYRTVKKRVLKTPATTQKVTIPAEYKTVRVNKLVTPAQEKVIEIPAEYQTVTKKQKLSDEVVGWRPEGAQGVGETTGKVVCRSEIPAKYATVTKQVLKAPATTRKVVVPAKYETVKVRKLLTPAQEKKIEVPAKFEAVTKRVKVKDEQLAWRTVLCETNTSPDLVTQIQRALQKAGYDPGPVDGRMGGQTQTAIDAFQRKQGLERGGLTMRTLSALGVKVGS